MTDPFGGLPEPAPPPPEPSAARAPRLHTPTTYALLAVLGLVFILQIALSHDSSGQDPVTLFRLGSLYAPAVLRGDWWRLGSYAFLHIGLAHLLVNCYALWVLMRPLEATYGQATALGLFAACALLGGGASLGWALVHGHAVQAAGASGGVFGLFGATVALYVRLRHRIPREALRAALRALVINLAINAAIAVSFPVDNAAHLGGFLSGILLGLLAPLRLVERRFWHGPVHWLLTASAFVLAAMEGAAIAHAAHPRLRTLHGPGGVEAQVSELLAPIEPGVAVCPGAFLLGISREDLPLRIEPGEDSVRIGDRTFLRQRSTSPEKMERTLLATADRGGRLVVELDCNAEICRGAGAEQFYLPAAQSVHANPPAH